MEHETSVGEIRDVVKCFPYFLSALSASLLCKRTVLYKRTDHMRGFFICFMIKKFLISAVG